MAVKSKSMTTEEIHLNEALEEAGIVPVETDLGEYIIQLAHERPSHIIAPAIHKTKGQIRSEEHTSELQSQPNLVCRLLLEKKKDNKQLRCSFTPILTPGYRPPTYKVARAELLATTLCYVATTRH